MSASKKEVTAVKQSTALTLPERAARALKTVEIENHLTSLAASTSSILNITNQDAREQCHRAMMDHKTKRLEIEGRGKAAREDATAFSKAVIAEQNRLVAIISPGEERLEALRDAWDEARRAERIAKAKADSDRIAAIRSRIEQDIRCVPMRMAGRPAIELETAIKDVVAISVDDTFAEFKDAAAVIHAQALVTLRQMRDDRVAFEIEQQRLKDERANVERERIANEQTARAERERIAAEEAAAAVERKKLLDAELAKLQAGRAAAQAQRVREDEERRERQRVEDEQRRESDAAYQAALKAEREALEAQRAELASQAEAAKPAPAAEPAAAATAPEFVPTAEDLIALVADHYKVTHDQAERWLNDAFYEVA